MQQTAGTLVNPTSEEALAQAWQWSMMGHTAEPVIRAAKDVCAARANPAMLLEAEVIEFLVTAYYMPPAKLEQNLQRLQAQADASANPTLTALVAVARCHLFLTANDAENLAKTSQALAATPAVQNHPPLACINLWHRAISAFWLGQQELALRLAHEWTVRVEPLGMLHHKAVAMGMLGYLHSANALQYESGLTLMRRAREIESKLPVNRFSSMISARCLETMLWTGQPEAALQQLQEDMKRPGMLRALQVRHATVARIYLANGMLEQADEWLGQLSVDQMGQPFLAWQWRLSKVLLLNAQRRHREAAELAQAELLRKKDSVPPPADMIQLYQALQQAYLALGDTTHADDAEAQGQAYLWPALATTARSAFVSIHLDAATSPANAAAVHAPAASAPQLPLGRQRTIEKAVQNIQAEKVPAMLAQVSHEIRSPLAGVIGLAGLLELSNLDNRQRHWVQALSHSAHWMLVVVNDVLDLARLQSGRVALHPVSFDWRQLLGETCTLIEPLIGDKPVALNWHCANGVNPAWPGDPVRLRQVLHNLMSNAVKFTATGTIQVRVRTAGPQAVRVEVQDTGRGISLEAQARLFQPFEQAEPNKDSNQGSGLGLLLCRQLVHLMGGNIGVTSRSGEGSLFWFEVPALALEPAPVAKAA